MIIREIRLENVKSFGSPTQVIRLNRGVNAVSGPNGAGKSTVLEAIGAALFQHLPYKHESFVREGEGVGTISIIVESLVDGRTYEIVRKVGRGATHSVYDPDIGQHVARGEADVGRWLRHHLQVGAEIDLRSLFVDSIGPPQGTLTAAFLDSAQTRRAKFNKLLQVDDYETAFRNLLALETAIDTERAIADTTISSLEAQTRLRPDLESRRVEKRDEQVALARQLSALTAEREELDRALIEFDLAEQQLRAARGIHDVANERAKHADDLVKRARQDHQVARAAADTVARHQAARDRYLAAETTLNELEGQRPERDRWSITLNEWALNRSGLLGQLGTFNQSIADGERARDDIVEFRRRIPEQDVAESRLVAARDRKRTLDEHRRRMPSVRDQVERALARAERAESVLAAASRKRDLAAELSDRLETHRTLVASLAEIEQATGTLKTIREAYSAEKKRADSLRQKNSALEEQIGRLDRLQPAPVAVDTIEKQHRQIVEDRAAAAARLNFASQSRSQVSGGVCPLLLEPCRNLRPGVTLEGHFDGEIRTWQSRLDLLVESDATVIDQLRLAKQAADNRERLAALRMDHATLASEVSETAERLQETTRIGHEAAAVANGREVADRAVQAASAAVREAQAAVQIVSQIDDLTRDAADARKEAENRRDELVAIMATLETAALVEAEVEAAAAAGGAIGDPRGAIEHRQPLVDRLPSFYVGRSRLTGQIEAATDNVKRATEALAPFSNLDRLIKEQWNIRDESRPAYEAYTAAFPAAQSLARCAETLSEAEDATRIAAAEAARALSSVREASDSYDASAHQFGRERRTEIGSAVGENRAKLGAAAAEETRLNRELEAIRRLDLTLMAERRRIDEIDAERQLAGTMRSAIRAAGPEITRQLLAKISRTAAQINAEILNQPGIEVEWTTDYDIVTRRQGETRGFAQLSGGEQMAAALAIRMAAMRHLSRIRFAFLDEPTAHLDETRRSNLGDQVQRLQGFDQLVVISHDDTFDGLFGHVVRIVREDGQSRVMDGS